MAGESFVLDHPEFGDLLTIVASRQRVGEAKVEKDYWVTHPLWALQDARLRVYLSGPSGWTSSRRSFSG